MSFCCKICFDVLFQQIHVFDTLSPSREVSAAFEVWGADLVEVAPPLAGEIDGEPERTIQTAARYVGEQIRAALG